MSSVSGPGGRSEPGLPLPAPASATTSLLLRPRASPAARPVGAPATNDVLTRGPRQSAPAVPGATPSASPTRPAELAPTEARAARVPTDLAARFNIDPARYTQLERTLARHGLSARDVLTSYASYIDEHIVGPAPGNAEVQALAGSVRSIIGHRVLELARDVDSARERWGDGDNVRWVLNTRMRDQLTEVGQVLLPSARFFTQMTANPAYRTALQGSDLYRNGQSFRLFVDSTMLNIRQDLVERTATSMPTGLIGNTHWMSPLREERTRMAPLLLRFGESVPGLTSVQQSVDTAGLARAPSFLNARDRQTEEEVMVYYLAATLTQMPPVVGTVLGAGVDLGNVFSNRDATLQILQEAGLAPRDFEIDKGFMDRVTSAGGLVLSAAGLQGAARLPALRRALSSLGRVTPEQLTRAAQRLSAALGRSPPPAVGDVLVVRAGLDRVDGTVTQLANGQASVRIPSGQTLEVEARQIRRGEVELPSSAAAQLRDPHWRFASARANLDAVPLPPAGTLPPRGQHLGGGQFSDVHASADGTMVIKEIRPQLRLADGQYTTLSHEERAEIARRTVEQIDEMRSLGFPVPRAWVARDNPYVVVQQRAPGVPRDALEPHLVTAAVREHMGAHDMARGHRRVMVDASEGGRNFTFDSRTGAIAAWYDPGIPIDTPLLSRLPSIVMQW